MKTKKGRYPSEDVFAKEFCSFLESNESPWGQVNVVREFNYSRGRTDVVAVDQNNNVFAFELKLKKWSQAMQQAYRNTCFAHSSFVVLPESTARLAHRYCRDFTRRSIGLCSITDGEVFVLVPAVHQEPIQPWLSNIAISKSGGNSRDESSS
jgi:hypothetical protein